MSAAIEDDVLSETENMFIWRSQEEGVGYIFHIELGGVTLHLLPDEWDEFVVLMRSANS